MKIFALVLILFSITACSDPSEELPKSIEEQATDLINPTELSLSQCNFRKADDSEPTAKEKTELFCSPEYSPQKKYQRIVAILNYETEAIKIAYDENISAEVRDLIVKKAKSAVRKYDSLINGEPEDFYDYLKNRDNLLRGLNKVEREVENLSYFHLMWLATYGRVYVDLSRGENSVVVLENANIFDSLRILNYLESDLNDLTKHWRVPTIDEILIRTKFIEPLKKALEASSAN